MKRTTVILTAVGILAAVTLLALISSVTAVAQQLPPPYPPSLPTFVTLQPFPVTPPAEATAVTPYPQGSPMPPPDGPVATATATPMVVTPTPQPEVTVTAAEIINLCHTPNPADAGNVSGQYWYSTDPCGGNSCDPSLVGSLYYDPQLQTWLERYIVYVCVDFTTGVETCDWGLTAIGQPTLPPPYVMYCSWPGDWGGPTPPPPPLP